MLSATLTFAQTRDCDITEQYVDLDNSINFIFMRDQNQEGGTSTPGKCPGCSEHVYSVCFQMFQSFRWKQKYIKKKRMEKMKH